jgi:hypothetical protein
MKWKGRNTIHSASQPTGYIKYAAILNGFDWLSSYSSGAAKDGLAPNVAAQIRPITKNRDIIVKILLAGL